MNFFLIFSFFSQSYMYCGSVNLTKLQFYETLNLLLPSDELGLQPLVMYIQEILIKNHINKYLKRISNTLGEISEFKI